MDLITTDKAAKMLYTTPYTIRKYIRRGMIQAVKIGKQYLIQQKAVESFLEALRTAPSPTSKGSH